MRYKFLLVFLLSLVFSPIVQADITSYDNTFTANDVFASDFHTRLNANFTRSLTGGINNITSANIVNDTLTEADMADEINPRVRTYEAAACEYVYTGLVPATSASLTSDISAGTAYPRGYRINKASATSHTYTASKWTYVDLDINGDFQYSEQTIGGSAPAVASNSIRLARVSSDGVTINTVTDLRRTSCTAGPFNVISNASSEADLDDLLKVGVETRRFSLAGRTPSGMARGAFVSFDTATTLKVTSGALYINGKYRAVSTDITVPTSADDPANGISGIDSGSLSAGKWYVYAVADQESVKTYSVTLSTNASAPAGITNARLIGSVYVDATNLFTSSDVVTAHAVTPREIAGAWGYFNGAASVLPITDSFNISSYTDNGTGDYTATFEKSFRTANYSAVGSAYDTDVPVTCNVATVSKSVSSYRFATYRAGTGTATDCEDVNFQIFGDTIS